MCWRVAAFVRWVVRGVSGGVCRLCGAASCGACVTAVRAAASCGACVAAAPCRSVVAFVRWVVLGVSGGVCRLCGVASCGSCVAAVREAASCGACVAAAPCWRVASLTLHPAPESGNGSYRRLTRGMLGSCGFYSAGPSHAGPISWSAVCDERVAVQGVLP
jgi:hypothetical protein